MTPFDLVLVPFPFSDRTAAVKQRPCFVLASFKPRGLEEHCLVSMVTSRLDGISFKGDVLVTHWKEAGLLKPSLIRLAKLVTMDSTLLRRKLGVVHSADRFEIGKILSKILAAVL